MGTGVVVIAPGILVGTGFYSNGAFGRLKLSKTKAYGDDCLARPEFYSSCLDTSRFKDERTVQDDTFFGWLLIGIGSVTFLSGGYLCLTGGENTDKDLTKLEFLPYANPDSIGTNFGLTF